MANNYGIDFGGLDSIYGTTAPNFNGVNLDLSGLNNTYGTSALGSGLGTTTIGPSASPNWFSDLGNSISRNQAAIQGIGSGIMGLANFYSAAQAAQAQKQQIALAMDQWNTNKANYRQTTNNALYERQNKAVSANPNATPVSEYMNTWSLK